jgi:hypothetical protein
MVVVAVLALVACTNPASAERVPTRDEAVGLLDDAVRLARAHDFSGLCRLGGGNCLSVLDAAGRDAVPAAAPTVAGDTVLPPSTRGDGSVDVGGRVLVLCGVDGRARPYRTEMVVFFQNGKLTAIEPIYWSGMSVGASSSPVTATRPPASSAPIACG